MQGVQHSFQALDGQKLGLYRNHQVLGSGQCIHHEHTQRRRVVENHVVKIIPQLGQGTGDNQPHTLNANHPTLQGGQCSTGRQQRQPGATGIGDQLRRQAFRDLALMLKQVKHAVGNSIRVITKPAGQRPVRIQINHQHTLATLGQQSAQSDHRGCLPHSTFLIGYSPDTHVLFSGNGSAWRHAPAYVQLIGKDTGNLKAESMVLRQPLADSDDEQQVIQEVCQLSHTHLPPAGDQRTAPRMLASREISRTTLRLRRRPSSVSFRATG